MKPQPGFIEEGVVAIPAESQPPKPAPLLVVGSTVLVTTDNWFFVPNGRSYKAVFGTVRSIRTTQELLGQGVQRTGNMASWYLEIGNMTIAGCEIHYSVACAKAECGNVRDGFTDVLTGKVKTQIRLACIYNADEN
jgi:hypothetical protein